MCAPPPPARKIRRRPRQALARVVAPSKMGTPAPTAVLPAAPLLLHPARPAESSCATSWTAAWWTTVRRANVAAHIGGSVHGPYCTVSREPLEISAGEVLVHTQRELGSWIEAHTQGNAWVFHTLHTKVKIRSRQALFFSASSRILPSKKWTGAPSPTCGD